MKVSLLIPALNEECCIGRVLREVPRSVVDEIIVIDGNSTDQTVKETRQILQPQDKLIIQKNGGYGAAYLEAFTMATGDVIIMMNADGSHNPRYIPKLLEKMTFSPP